MEGKEYPDLHLHPQNPPPYAAPPPHSLQPPPAPVIVVPGPVIQNQPNSFLYHPFAPSVTSTVLANNQLVGPKPSNVTCPSCGVEIVTRVEHQATTKTHFIAMILCMLGCWCCCCIPYCTGTCRNANHYCPNCNSYIGAYSA